MLETGAYNFSVASELLRELGERLVGRQHVALAELIKNSYDADAETCVVRVFDDRIEVEDNGHGMTPNQFEEFWMRIGSTHKVDRRRSPEKHRELTGSKGVGRLAAQFVADRIVLETTGKEKIDTTLRVNVDWQEAQQAGDLTAYKAQYWIDDRITKFPGGSNHGMRIQMEGLKHKWNENDLEDLGLQVWALRSPLAYLAPSRARGDFDVLLMAGEEKLEAAFDEVLEEALSSWKAKISGKLVNGLRGDSAHVAVEFIAGYGADEPEIVSETVDLPIVPNGNRVDSGPALDELTLEILIFRAEGRQKKGIPVSDLRGYLAKYGGVHVYDGSFRLPHYGGVGNEDWLSIGEDHARRLSNSELLPRHLQVDRMMLDLPQMRRIFGVASVSTRHEADVVGKHGFEPGKVLTINISRDRLVDNTAYKQLRNLVRWSLDFYVSRYRARTLRQAERGRSKEPAAKKLHRLMQVLKEHASAMPDESHTAIKREVDDYLKATRADDRYRESAAALLAPLATAGMNALAMTHELQREFSQMIEIDRRLREIAQEKKIPELYDISVRLMEWRERTEALQEMFAPLVGTGQDRNDAYPLRALAVARQTVSAMKPLLPGVEVEFQEQDDKELRLPTGTMAEWSALFQNIVSNAWNAMIETSRSRIRIEAGEGSRMRRWVRISDTGCGLGMPPNEADRLFNPFERALTVSRDRRTLMIGGRGLGLTIARMIAHRRGAEVRFVDPPQGYATTIELSW